VLDPVKIVYVLGRSHIGSAYIEHAIAQKSGIVHLGEVQLWPICHADDHMCSCGKAKTECSFWVPVIEGLENPEKTERAFLRTMKRSYLTSPLLPGFLKKLLFPGVSKHLLEFYDRIRSTSGRDVMLDSSRNPAYGASLSQTPGLNVVFIHVVRHPLSEVYACKRQRMESSEAAFPNAGKSLARVALEWSITNLLCEFAKIRNPLKSSYLRYENLADPSSQDMVLHQVELAKGGEDHPPLSHMMSDNSGITSWDEEEFAFEDEWKTGLSWFEKLFYGALTYPLFAFYAGREET